MKTYEPDAPASPEKPNAPKIHRHNEEYPPNMEMNKQEFSISAPPISSGKTFIDLKTLFAATS